jgi:hypothetical protein
VTTRFPSGPLPPVPPGGPAEHAIEQHALAEARPLSVQAQGEAARDGASEVSPGHVDRARWRLTQQRQARGWRSTVQGVGWALFGGGLQGLVAEFRTAAPNPGTLLVWFVMTFAGWTLAILAR